MKFMKQHFTNAYECHNESLHYGYYEYQITDFCNENRQGSLNDHSRIYMKCDECYETNNESVVNRLRIFTISNHIDLQ